MPTLQGRIVAIDGKKVTVRHERGTETAEVRGGDREIYVADIVRIEDGILRVLTPNRPGPRPAPPRMTWMERVLDPRRLRGNEIRSRVESGIREFFLSQGFRDVRTPLLVFSPGTEPHIKPFRVEGGAHLPTSPEFAMKRLLVGGLERIFQLCPAFRNEPYAKTHHPEFTMLEWYRAFAGYEDIMRDTEELFAFLARRIHGRAAIPWQGREISVEPPWPRLRVRDLFLEHAGVDLVRADTAEKLAAECRRLGIAPGRDVPGGQSWDDLYFLIWLNLIEPRLPADRAVIVTRYPASQSAFCNVDEDPDGSRWARRFEVYAGGLELANAFDELTDPFEQRARFVRDMKERDRFAPGAPRNPFDEELLLALEEGMPPTGGIALGVDRLVMLLADEPDIQKTLWLRSYSPEGLASAHFGCCSKDDW
jgi:lysyl-tRNA synthetase class 2